MSDELLNSMIGKSVSSTPQTQLPKETVSKTTEKYQFPVKTGQTGKNLDEGDKPWIMGGFSPNAPTDSRHKFHNGTDCKAPINSSFYPVASGVVKNVGTGEKSGNWVSILHENGYVQSFYAHANSISVSAGQKVTQSTELGKIGTTGNAKGTQYVKNNVPYGHTHVEIKIDGKLVDLLSIIGKPVGSLSKKAELINNIEKLSNLFIKMV